MSEMAATVSAAMIPQQLCTIEQRKTPRHESGVDTLSTNPDNPGMSWGAKVRNVSTTGLGMRICYPFKPGTALEVRLQESRVSRSLQVRVVHAIDLTDGNWLLGCEFTQPLTEEEVSQLL